MRDLLEAIKKRRSGQGTSTSRASTFRNLATTVGTRRANCSKSPYEKKEIKVNELNKIYEVSRAKAQKAEEIDRDL
jgi:hypothetical protein